MGDRRSVHGQALVEWAILFPIVLLMLACLLQLPLLLRLHMRMHTTATRMAAQLAMGRSSAIVQASALYDFRDSFRWGFPIPKTYTEPLPYWRKYKGIGTTDSTNCMAIGELTFPLSGHWFASVGLPTMMLHAKAELPCEPFQRGN